MKNHNRQAAMLGLGWGCGSGEGRERVVHVLKMRELQQAVLGVASWPSWEEVVKSSEYVRVVRACKVGLDYPSPGEADKFAHDIERKYRSVLEAIIAQTNVRDDCEKELCGRGGRRLELTTRQKRLIIKFSALHLSRLPENLKKFADAAQQSSTKPTDKRVGEKRIGEEMRRLYAFESSKAISWGMSFIWCDDTPAVSIPLSFITYGMVKDEPEIVAFVEKHKLSSSFDFTFGPLTAEVSVIFSNQEGPELRGDLAAVLVKNRFIEGISHKYSRGDVVAKTKDDLKSFYLKFIDSILCVQ